jgi:hypothetical protein
VLAVAPLRPGWRRAPREESEDVSTGVLRCRPRDCSEVSGRGRGTLAGDRRSSQESCADQPCEPPRIMDRSARPRPPAVTSAMTTRTAIAPQTATGSTLLLLACGSTSTLGSWEGTAVGETVTTIKAGVGVGVAVGARVGVGRGRGVRVGGGRVGVGVAVGAAASVGVVEGLAVGVWGADAIDARARPRPTPRRMDTIALLTSFYPPGRRVYPPRTLSM